MEQLNMNTTKKLQGGVLAALILLSVFLGVKTIGEIMGFGTIGVEPGQNIISVTGEGEVFATADLATFSFSVEQEGATVAEAQKKSTEISEKAIKLLEDAGIEDKDIKTTGYNVGPKYDYNVRPCTAYNCPSSNPKIVGYEVSESIVVKVRKIDKAGGILSNLGATGVTNISSLEFTVDDEDALKVEARTKAIADAKEKAERLASDLDVGLGSVISFYESSEGGQPIMYAKAMDMAVGGATASSEAVPLAKGENKITVNVTITYRIK
jgi:uncharacterized protein YggE